MYVLFKGKYLYDNWTRNEPQNCRYNVTKNGWMDKLQLSQHSFRNSRSNSPNDMNRSLMRSRSSSRESYHSPVLPSYKRKSVKSPITVCLVSKMKEKSLTIIIRRKYKKLLNKISLNIKRFKYTTLY